MICLVWHCHLIMWIKTLKQTLHTWEAKPLRDFMVWMGTNLICLRYFWPLSSLTLSLFLWWLAIGHYVHGSESPLQFIIILFQTGWFSSESMWSQNHGFIHILACSKSSFCTKSRIQLRLVILMTLVAAFFVNQSTLWTTSKYPFVSAPLGLPLLILNLYYFLGLMFSVTELLRILH